MEIRSETNVADKTKQGEPSKPPSSGRFVGQMKEARLKERLLRWIGIGVLLFLVGACSIVLMARIWQFQVAIAMVAGILAMSAAFYLFVNLWPDEEKDEESIVARSLEKAKPKPVEISPEEYRRQRMAAQKLIGEKAAPILAKAIRGILRQDEMDQRRRKP